MEDLDWRTSTAGTKTRVAMWLHAEVGEGGAFTKAQLREAFPGVEQVDRRMRDLRSEGWQIDTYRIDRSLASDELRLVRVGGAVWDPTYRSVTASAPTAKARAATLLADGFICVYCGISGGETYPDEPLRTAKLSAARRSESSEGSSALVTLCDRCLAGQTAVSEEDWKTEFERLGMAEQQLLRDWARNERPVSRVLRLWSQYLRLPEDKRRALCELLR